MTFAGRDSRGRPVSGVVWCRKCRRLTVTVRDAALHDVCADCGLPAALTPTREPAAT